MALFVFLVFSKLYRMESNKKKDFKQFLWKMIIKAALFFALLIVNKIYRDLPSLRNFGSLEPEFVSWPIPSMQLSCPNSRYYALRMQSWLRLVYLNLRTIEAA